MRICSIDIPYEVSNEKGFERLKLSRLGTIVAFVGKNGSGKTRALDLIEQVAKESHRDELLAVSGKSKQDLPQHIIYTRDFVGLVNTKQLINCIQDLCISPNNDKYKELRSFIEKFLGKPLFYKRDLSGQRTGEGIKNVPTYDDRIFNFTELSPGEQRLFQWAYLLFRQKQDKIDISEAIIIVDEPEQHLHPEAQVGLLDCIKRVVGEKGQLWLATHSIHILAHLNYDDIYLVDQNTIAPPSRNNPGDSFLNLMGLDSYVDEFSNFVLSISNWAYANFIKQCMYSPETIESVNGNDPQVKVFKDSIFNKINTNEPMKMLDFGAGKGRIGEVIGEDNRLKQMLEYYALEPNVENLQILSSRIEQAKKIYNDYRALPDNFFDYIVICNVLHEIHPKKWGRILGKLVSALNEDGFLIIIEDKILPKGEKPNGIGFLILDRPELEFLFNCEIGQILHPEPRYKDRILCVTVQKKSVKLPITKNNVLSAIEKLSETSFEKITKARIEHTIVLRRKSLSQHDGELHRFGRTSAFYTQLHINALLALKCLKRSKLKSVNNTKASNKGKNNSSDRTGENQNRTEKRLFSAKEDKAISRALYGFRIPEDQLQAMNRALKDIRLPEDQLQAMNRALNGSRLPEDQFQAINKALKDIGLPEDQFQAISRAFKIY